MADAQIPRKLGRYVIEKEIGGGTAAKVYLGHHELTGQKVAVKAVTRDKYRYARRLIIESDILLHIDHPNIIRVYSTGETEDYLWYSMKLYEKNLSDFLNPSPWTKETESQDLPLLTKLHILTDVLRALVHIHKPTSERPTVIVHRDIAPPNILIDNTYNACLSDFGLLKIGESPEFSDELRGNPKFYGAPEQDRELGSAKPASDIFSFAFVAYQFISGIRPVGTDVRDLHTLKEEVYEALSLLIHRSLHNWSPEVRPSAEELLEAFERSFVDEVRRRIVLTLREHPEGLSSAETRRLLGVDKDLGSTMRTMVRDGLLRRIETGRYVV